MTANEKLAHKKLPLLELAEELKSVSDACRIMKVSRSQFYEIKRAFQTGGLAALLDKPPIPGSTPHKLPEETESKIIELSTRPAG
jgi:transposase